MAYSQFSTQADAPDMILVPRGSDMLMLADRVDANRLHNDRAWTEDIERHIQELREKMLHSGSKETREARRKRESRENRIRRVVGEACGLLRRIIDDDGRWIQSIDADKATKMFFECPSKPKKGEEDGVDSDDDEDIYGGVGYNLQQHAEADDERPVGD